MKIFVPKFRHDLPHYNADILCTMLAQIHRDDLHCVITYWEAFDRLTAITDPNILRKSIRGVCRHDLKNGAAFEPYLRRPHITVHTGSKGGSGIYRKLFGGAMYEVGRLVARHGFNFWYGGGDKGLMGESLRGFLNETAKHRYPDQYSLQIIPASFVYGVKSQNGFSPSNEGLCDQTDIAIVLPDFVSRRELLDSKCVAAIEGPGSIGTLDELTDILCHNKVGLRNIPCYLLNVHIKERKRGYYDSLLEQLEISTLCGMGNDQILSFIKQGQTPKELFDHLMKTLNAEGNNPHDVYNSRIRDDENRPERRTPAVRSIKGFRLG